MDIECPECGKKFSSQEGMEQHKNDKHRAEEKPKKQLNTKRIAVFGVIAIIIIVIGFVLMSSPSSTYVIQNDRTNFAGPSDAPIVVTEYSDFQCPYCGQASQTANQIKEKYGDQIKFVYSHFPLTQIHPYAQKAAEAAECAGDQNKFWEYHDKLFANQNSLYINSLKEYAKQTGLDTEAFNSCLDSGIMAGRVSYDSDEALSKGVRSTPTFFVNSIKIEGAQPMSQFERVIDTALATS